MTLKRDEKKGGGERVRWGSGRERWREEQLEAVGQRAAEEEEHTWSSGKTSFCFLFFMLCFVDALQ